jgi:hypothetical protein
MAGVGTRNFFLSPQLQFRNLKEALLQSQFLNFLKTCCSAIPQSQSATSSLQLESFTSSILSYFWSCCGIRLIHEKKSEKKILCYCPFNTSFWFPEKQTVVKILLVDFKIILSWGKGIESSSAGKRLRKISELRKSNFEGPQSQFCNFS